MKDSNEIMPKIAKRKWGALLNKVPTNKSIEHRNKRFHHNGKWHTVFDEKDQVFVDGKRIWKKDFKSWS